jgi:Uma2 family endonuclease
MSAAKVIDIPKRITARQYFDMADPDLNTEPVRGRIVVVPPPKSSHGRIRVHISYFVERFLERHSLGRAVCNDTGVQTEYDPDTVRGADFAYFSFTRWPKKKPRWEEPPSPPEIVFEVRSPSGRTTKVMRKVDEYLEVGVDVVCVLDDRTESVTIYRADSDEKMLTSRQMLTFPDILPGFSVLVSKIFE